MFHVLFTFAMFPCGGYVANANKLCQMGVILKE